MGGLHIVFDLDLCELIEGHHVIAAFRASELVCGWRIDDLPSHTAIMTLRPCYGSGVEITAPGRQGHSAVATETPPELRWQLQPLSCSYMTGELGVGLTPATARLHNASTSPDPSAAHRPLIVTAMCEPWPGPERMAASTA